MHLTPKEFRNWEHRAITLLGMSGTATVFAEDAGAIGFLAKVLLWVRVQLLYL